MENRIEANLALIKKIPFFTHYTDEIQQAIAEKMMELPFEEGETILNEGTEGRRLYVIEAGKVGVYKNGAEIITLGVGDFFGEISLITSEKRTASVVALENTQTVVLKKEDFQELLKLGFFRDQEVKEELFRRIRENYAKGW